MRDRGHEFGTTTGRERRCGWLDLVALRYATRLNRLSALAITKLDVLSGLDPLRVAVRYRGTEGAVFEEFPYHQSILHTAVPEYEEFPGWEGDITECRTEADLPAEARDYLAAISDSTGVPISLVGVGPGRDEVITSAAAEHLVVSSSAAEPALERRPPAARAASRAPRSVGGGVRCGSDTARQLPARRLARLLDRGLAVQRGEHQLAVVRVALEDPEVGDHPHRAGVGARGVGGGGGEVELGDERAGRLAQRAPSRGARPRRSRARRRPRAGAPWASRSRRSRWC